MKNATPDSFRRLFRHLRVRRGDTKLSEDLTGLSLIVGVVLVFQAITFMAARLIAYFLTAGSLGAILVIWLMTTLLGIVLVRQLHSLTDRGGNGLMH
jgi:hypothetical protein